MPITMPFSKEYVRFFEYAMAIARDDGVFAAAFERYPFETPSCMKTLVEDTGQALPAHMSGVIFILMLFLIAAAVVRVTRNDNLEDLRRAKERFHHWSHDHVDNFEEHHDRDRHTLSEPADDVLFAAVEAQVSPPSRAPAAAEPPAIVPDETQAQIAAKAAAKQKAEYKSAFDRYDMSNDGNVDCAELKHLMQALGEDASDKHVQALMEKFDSDGSGQLDFEEFTQVMHIQKSWVRSHDEKRDRDYWFNTVTQERTWVDPNDPLARAQNLAVQKFVALLEEAELSCAVVPQVFEVFDEVSSILNRQAAPNARRLFALHY